MKDHPNLILGFYAFLPPEANKGFGQSQTMVERRRTPDATMDAAFSYAVDLMEAFYAEPEKFDEFTKLLKDIKAHRYDCFFPVLFQVSTYLAKHTCEY